MNLKKWLPNIITLLLAALLVVTQQAWAGPLASLKAAPSVASSRTTMAYQGYLTDATGNPVNGSISMVFRLYNIESGGAALWNETQNDVLVTDGAFSVLLGKITPIPLDILATNQDLWLGITIGSDAEMIPREKLVSAPYAMFADVPDSSISQHKLADNSVTSAKIQDGQVTGADIANNTVTEADIADDFVARNSDKLDGYDYNTLPYAASSHLHDDRYYTEGESDGRYAGAGHAHDDRYFTEGEADGRFINASGDTMGGNLDMGGSAINNTSAVQIGAQGSISDKRDVGGAGPNMTFETDDAFSFQVSGRYFRILPDAQRIEVSNNLRIVTGYMDHIILDDNIYTMRPSGQSTVDLGHPLHKFGAIFGAENHIGAMIETGLESLEEQSHGIGGVQEGDLLCWTDDHLEVCRRANDRMVQAVASAAGHPIVLGAELIKIIGPVRTGDLLVSSVVPGYAMVNNNPSIGTVIGQALADFNQEKGLIKAMIRKF